ncbi:toll/interleukin-1 receptor (TIR) domain-containing protein [Artemisia annua]|uniref:Toll/interleukin-1 receptor (TIR) domain-containing protein n=1 Tax=Artemisia annua TaxID=35608 RepID=A0A2U1PRF2_ARTAN|nr:toll/interleukin-1 receptor (TIR) domain-containing protein [Artemisia annua]
MGGAGKTTLARAIFDQISIQFEGESFIENVREVSKASSEGLKNLQKQVLTDVLKDKNIEVSSVSGGKHMMQRRMRGRKVLVVLDDVDHKDQLEALAGDLNWFKPGSRVIIATREKQVLVAHRVSLIHNVTLLSQAEAGCLFNRHAFGRENPIQGYEELSRQVVQYAHGLPLTIKVLGSFLCGQSEPYWVDAIERLKKIPLKATMERLEISFDGLEDDYKEIFLDVACILKGWRKKDAIRVLESRGFHAKVGLRVLEQKSLITISEKWLGIGSMYLGMHDHLEEMGRNIVRRSHPDEPQRHSRLWVNEEIEDILTNDLGTQATKCLYFDPWGGFSAEVAVKGLAKMKDLRYLHISSGKNAVHFDRVSEYLPSSLRFMRWRGFPFSSLPKTFQGKYLVGLEMDKSDIVKLWEDGEEKVLHNLRFLYFYWCSNLQTLDLRLAPNLEQLTIDSCRDFVELQMPAESLKLKCLVLTDSKLKTLHLGNTPNLEKLILKGCNDLVELQMPAERLKLEYIDFSDTKLKTLDLGLTPNLEWLKLKNCYDLVEINAPIGCGRFKSFVFDKRYQPAEAGSVSELHLIAEPTDDDCPLHSDNDSPKFRFRCYYKEDPNSSFGNLERLISLGLCACTNLESFSRSICGLQCLTKLTLEGSITEAPPCLDQLDCLEELTFSYTEIKHLPDSICKLKHLKSLKIKSCWLLEKLPDDIGRLESLEKLILSDCSHLQDIPNNICKMKFINTLRLRGCIRVVELPEDIGCLEDLKELNVEGTGITRLPRSIFQLRGLRIVGTSDEQEAFVNQRITVSQVNSDRGMVSHTDSTFSNTLFQFDLSRSGEQEAIAIQLRW